MERRHWPPARQQLARAVVYAGKRERCAIAIAELAQAEGPEALTTTRIIQRTRIGRNTFYELFETREQGLQFACDMAGERLASPIEEEAEGPGAWPERVERAIAALLTAVSEESHFAELYLIHRPGLETSGRLRREATVDALIEALRPGRAEAGSLGQPPGDLEELIAGGIVAVIATRLRRGQLDSLSALRGELVALALAPYRPARERPVRHLEAVTGK